MTWGALFTFNPEQFWVLGEAVYPLKKPILAALNLDHLGLQVSQLGYTRSQEYLAVR